MSKTGGKIPIIDLEPYLHGRKQQEALRNLTLAMTQVGVVIVRDPRFDRTLPALAREIMLAFFRKSEKAKRRRPSGSCTRFDDWDTNWFFNYCTRECAAPRRESKRRSLMMRP